MTVKSYLKEMEVLKATGLEGSLGGLPPRNVLETIPFTLAVNVTSTIFTPQLYCKSTKSSSS